jgi:hypothetical protein
MEAASAQTPCSSRVDEAIKTIRDESLKMAMAMGNGASQARWRRDKLRATRATQTRIVEQDDETYRISGARVDFD